MTSRKGSTQCIAKWHLHRHGAKVTCPSYSFFWFCSSIASRIRGVIHAFFHAEAAFRHLETSALRQGWATCPLTENGFLRVFGGKSYPGGPGCPQEARRALQSLLLLPGHQFWADDLSLSDARQFPNLPASCISQIIICWPWPCAGVVCSSPLTRGSIHGGSRRRQASAGFNRMSTFAKSHESLHPIDLCAARSHSNRPCSVCRVYRVSQWAGPLSLNKSAKSAQFAVHITEVYDAA